MYTVWVCLTFTGAVYAPWMNPGNFIVLSASTEDLICRKVASCDLHGNLNLTLFWKWNSDPERVVVPWSLALQKRATACLFLSRLLSPLRLSAWWPQRWCRDTRSFSSKGVSQNRSSRSTSVLFLSGWRVGSDCVSQTHMDTLLSFRDAIFCCDTHKGTMTIVFCKCSQTAAHSVWNHSLIPCGHFCYWFTPQGYLWKAKRKYQTNVSLHQSHTDMSTMSVLISSQLIQKELLTWKRWLQRHDRAGRAYSCDRYSGLTFVWFVL